MLAPVYVDSYINAFMFAIQGLNMHMHYYCTMNANEGAEHSIE